MRRHFDPFVTKEMLRKAAVGGVATQRDKWNLGILKSGNLKILELESGNLGEIINKVLGNVLSLPHYHIIKLAN